MEFLIKTLVKSIIMIYVRGVALHINLANVTLSKYCTFQFGLSKTENKSRKQKIVQKFQIHYQTSTFSNVYKSAVTHIPQIFRSIFF